MACFTYIRVRAAIKDLGGGVGERSMCETERGVGERKIWIPLKRETESSFSVTQLLAPEMCYFNPYEGLLLIATGKQCDPYLLLTNTSPYCTRANLVPPALQDPRCLREGQRGARSHSCHDLY